MRLKSRSLAMLGMTYCCCYGSSELELYRYIALPLSGSAMQVELFYLARLAPAAERPLGDEMILCRQGECERVHVPVVVRFHASAAGTLEHDVVRRAGLRALHLRLVA